MKKQDNSIKIVGIIVTAVLIMFFALFFTIRSDVDKQVITVQGEATISVIPDIVSINFLVETTGNTSKEAKDANSLIVDVVVESLMAQGFNRSDIETMNFNIYEEYDWTKDGRKPLGYKANHNIRLRFDSEEYPELGAIIDAGVDAGALLSYISFELSTETENMYKAQALALAGTDAKMKAESMVSGVGGRLGRLVSVSESNFGYQPWRAYDMAYAEAGVKLDSFDESTSIQIGEKEITGRLTVVYEIK